MTDRWIKRENDYGGILEVEPTRSCSISVVIPAYEAPAVLERTLAGLAGQETDAMQQVVVVDDGSPVPLVDVVDSFAEILPVTYVRQDYDGFGAGRARNLGASLASSDVLLFVDADCIPAATLVEQHRRWHDRVANAVVVGSRIDVDAGDWTANQIRTGTITSREFKSRQNRWSEVPAADWRAMFYRRNRRLVIDDAAYRACVSNNLSMSRSAFEEARGFSDVFTTWGGEDTELGWRLFQDGNFVIPDESAVVFHQVQGEDSEAREVDRARQRLVNRALIADRIPNRAYRSIAASTYSVPRLTWLVWGRDEASVAANLRWVDAAGVLDNEVVLVGPAAAVELWVSRGRSSDRFSVVDVDRSPTLEDVLSSIRGEFVACVGDLQSADVSLIHRAMKRFSDDPRLAVVQAPYVDAEGGVARRPEDLVAFDRERGFPAFCVVRRRAIAKVDRSVVVADAVAGAVHVERAALVSNPKVRVHSSLQRASRYPNLATLRRLGAEELLRSTRAKLKSDPRSTPNVDPSTERQGISYIGFTGRSNLGDEAVLHAVRGLLPEVEISREQASPAALMLGGGTIINAKRYYLTRVLREDRPGIQRFVFAPGVRDPAYWGVTEPMDEWWSFFRSAEPITVRGPDSAEHLRTLGWKGEVEVIGDPALSLRRPGTFVRTDEVIVAPLNTGGNLFGGNDSEVLDAMAAEVRRLAADGLSVTLMSSFPEDDRWILELERIAEVPSLGYLAGYADLDATLSRIAGARLVIGERLHASILAAAMGTPFVPVAYRPKVLDFARSVGAQDLVVATDTIDRLQHLVELMLNDGQAHQRQISLRVEELRAAQRHHARMIEAALGEMAT